MLNRLLRTKPLRLLVAETEAGAHQLHRVLTVWDLVALGLGAIIGVGISLLLDSRVVDVPMSSNPIVVTLSSLKPFFFNDLQ